MLSTTSATDIWNTTTEGNNNFTENYYDVAYYSSLSSNFVTVLSSIALLAGITSWIIVAKWRSFKNYVFLNMILSALLNNLTDLLVIFYFSDSTATPHSMYLAYSSSLFSFNLWLLIVCLMFYSDIVKVYKVSTNRRYLKSALLGWGMPSVTLIIVAVLDQLLDVDGNIDLCFYALIFISTLIFMIANFVLYLRVLCSLAKNPNVRRSGSFTCSKIQVSTVLFLMTGAASMPSFFFFFFAGIEAPPSWFTVVVENVTFLPIVNSCVYLFASRTNREAWKRYYDKKIKNHVTSGSSVV